MSIDLWVALVFQALRGAGFDFFWSAFDTK